MAFKETEIATNAVIKMNQKKKEKGSTAAIRVTQRTRDLLEDLVLQANKNKVGRKIKCEDIVSFSLTFIGDEQLQQIRDRALTNKDRIEVLFRKVSKEKKGLTRDEFLGLLMEGKLTH